MRWLRRRRVPRHSDLWRQGWRWTGAEVREWLRPGRPMRGSSNGQLPPGRAAGEARRD